MLRKLILIIIISIFGFVLPAYAASNDVTFTTDTTFYISDLGINLTVASGSRVASFTLNTGSIIFNMENGSSASVLSADKRTLNNSKASTICHTTYSYVILNSNTTETITVTPSASTDPCGYSGWSGGGTVLVVTPTTTPSVAVIPLASVTIPALPSKPTNADIENVLIALTRQIAYIQAHITAPNALTLIEEVVTRLSGLQTAVSSFQVSVVPAAGSYLVPLSFGSRGEGVTALQNFLSIREPDVYLERLVTGYFGPLTEKAIGKFQEKYGIVNSDDPGYGFVGPRTRAKINELLGL